MNTRPYIIINGKDSRLIPGLIITELPPITKPKIRTQIETIDGRDGDLVTELGYAAYDKTINIGLTYDYNIDDIISFFNQSGVIVFGNEPDKYYRFAIYSQINFERLVRFKKSKFALHVQPFKFSVSETLKTFTFDQDNGSFNIRNNGNYFSRPIITLTGSDDIDVYINGVKVLTVELNTDQTIIINSEEMNATDPTGEYLLNRLVIGNYDNIKLTPGKNTISFVGDVSRATINNYSRWI